MKTSFQRFTTYLTMLLLTTVILHGCSNVAGPDGLSDADLISENYSNLSEIGRFATSGTNSGDSDARSCSASGEYQLKASKQSKDAGTVKFAMGSNEIVITYTATDGWEISETHLFVSNDLNDLPTAGNGAPVNGHFPYGDEFSTPQTEATYTIPLSDIGVTPGDDIYIVAHAVVNGANEDSYSVDNFTYTASSADIGYNNFGWSSGKWGKKSGSKKGSKWGKKGGSKKGSKWGKKGGSKKGGKWGDKDDDDNDQHRHGAYCDHDDKDDDRDKDYDEKSSGEETAYAGDEEGDGPRWWWYIHSETKSCSSWGKTE